MYSGLHAFASTHKVLGHFQTLSKTDLLIRRHRTSVDSDDSDSDSDSDVLIQIVTKGDSPPPRRKRRLN